LLHPAVWSSAAVLLREHRLDLGASGSRHAFGNALGGSIADEMGPQEGAGGSGLRLSADAANSWGPQSVVPDVALRADYGLGDSGAWLGGRAVDDAVADWSLGVNAGISQEAERIAGAQRFLDMAPVADASDVMGRQFQHLADLGKSAVEWINRTGRKIVDAQTWVPEPSGVGGWAAFGNGSSSAGIASTYSSGAENNKFDGYNLSTKEGLKNFISDVSVAKSLGYEIPGDMAQTARQVAASYFGVRGSLSSVAKTITGLSDAQLTDRLDENIGRIDMYSRLNEKFGTNIDFQFIAKNEGGQLLRAYVPMKNGAPMDDSGATVATGFDIGQHSKEEVAGMGLNVGLTAKLLPYAALGPKQPFKGMDALAFLSENPLSISREEAMEIDYASKALTVSKMLRNWSSNDPYVPFTQLSNAQQTVLADRSFHQGANLMRTAARGFYEQALDGEWGNASDALLSMSIYNKYKARIDANIARLSGGR
jgi:hypothetical protein